MDIYKTSFALYTKNRGFMAEGEPKDSEIYCAWCHKTIEDIKKTEEIDKHLENHDKEKNGV